MTTMYGADADGLDRVAAQISTAAEELQAEMNALTANLRSIEWLGPIATSFTDEWMGTGLAQIRSTTGFLKAASTDLQQQATAQREASKGGGPHGGSIHATGTGSGSTPGAKIRARFDANRAKLEEFLRTLPPDSSLRKAIEKNLAAGAEIYYFDPKKRYIAWATPNLVNAKNVVMTIPGTSNNLETVTNDFLGQAKGYQGIDPNVAVMSTYTWDPPDALWKNLFVNGFDSLGDGPTPGIIRSLYSEGKSIVPTAHSAGGKAVQSMMIVHPDLAWKVKGVALLSPSELDPRFPSLMQKANIVLAVRAGDPMIGKLSSLNVGDGLVFNGAPNVRIVGGVVAVPRFSAHDQDLYIKDHGRDIVGLFGAPTPTPQKPYPKLEVPTEIDPTQPIS